MRINLKVPYAEKDEAKRLGARWDADKKVWFVVDPESLDGFVRWLPSKPLVVGRPNTKRGVTTFVRNGALPDRTCSCPPWEFCEHYPA